MSKPIVAHNNQLFVRKEPANGKPYYVHNKQQPEEERGVISFIATLQGGSGDE